MTSGEKLILGVLGFIAWELWQSSSVQAAAKGILTGSSAASTCSPNDSMVTSISTPSWIAALSDPKAQIFGVEGID